MSSQRKGLSIDVVETEFVLVTQCGILDIRPLHSKESEIPCCVVRDWVPWCAAPGASTDACVILHLLILSFCFLGVCRRSLWVEGSKMGTQTDLVDDQEDERLSHVDDKMYLHQPNWTDAGDFHLCHPLQLQHGHTTRFGPAWRARQKHGPTADSESQREESHRDSATESESDVGVNARCFTTFVPSILGKLVAKRSANKQSCMTAHHPASFNVDFVFGAAGSTNGSTKTEDCDAPDAASRRMARPRRVNSDPSIRREAANRGEVRKGGKGGLACSVCAHTRARSFLCPCVHLGRRSLRFQSFPPLPPYRSSAIFSILNTEGAINCFAFGLPPSDEGQWVQAERSVSCGADDNLEYARELVLRSRSATPLLLPRRGRGPETRDGVDSNGSIAAPRRSEIEELDRCAMSDTVLCTADRVRPAL